MANESNIQMLRVLIAEEEGSSGEVTQNGTSFIVSVGLTNKDWGTVQKELKNKYKLRCDNFDHKRDRVYGYFILPQTEWDPKEVVHSYSEENDIFSHKICMLPSSPAHARYPNHRYIKAWYRPKPQVAPPRNRRRLNNGHPLAVDNGNGNDEEVARARPLNTQQTKKANIKSIMERHAQTIGNISNQEAKSELLILISQFELNHGILLQYLSHIAFGTKKCVDFIQIWCPCCAACIQLSHVFGFGRLHSHLNTHPTVGKVLSERFELLTHGGQESELPELPQSYTCQVADFGFNYLNLIVDEPFDGMSLSVLENRVWWRDQIHPTIQTAFKTKYNLNENNNAEGN